MVRRALTQERLMSLLDYSPEDGLFRWKVNTNKIEKGSIAGTTKEGEYVRIKIDGSMQRAHRLVFLMEEGVFPEEMVDHIDGTKSNNQRTNLRKASRSQNNHNASIRKDSTTGVKGVSVHPDGRFKVRVGLNGVSKFIGLYDDLELASFVASESRNKYHGAFATI